MDYMSGKATALLGIVGAAAVGIYFKWQRPPTGAVGRRRTPSDVIEPKGSVSFRSSRRIEIDDDAAADIIKAFVRPQNAGEAVGIVHLFAIVGRKACLSRYRNTVRSL
jgi:hypothetical protein